MAGSDQAAAGDVPPLPGIVETVLPAVLGRGRIVQTPYPFRMADDDSLRVITINAKSGVTVNIQGRLVDSDSSSRPFDFTQTPTSDRAQNTKDFNLNAGLVTNLTVFASGATPLYGQTFVIVQLIRSTGATAFVMGTLLAGYITAVQSLGWPGSPIQNSVTDGGYLRQIQGTHPAAGAEIIETVPSGARWEVLGINITLTNSAAAGARYPRVFFVSSGFVPVLCLPQSGINPSRIGNYTYYKGCHPQQVGLLSNSHFSIEQSLPIGPMLLAGDAWKTNTDLLDASDQWSTPSYLVREWLEA